MLNTYEHPATVLPWASQRCPEVASMSEVYSFILNLLYENNIYPTIAAQ